MNTIQTMTIEAALKDVQIALTIEENSHTATRLKLRDAVDALRKLGYWLNPAGVWEKVAVEVVEDAV